MTGTPPQRTYLRTAVEAWQPPVHWDRLDQVGLLQYTTTTRLTGGV
jgi:hypothetical protein